MKLFGQAWYIWLRDFVIGGAIIALILAWQSRDMLEQDGSITPGNQLLVNLEGHSEPLLSEDKPTLVYFFAPWCQVCHLSIGNLEYIENDNVKIVRVALDYESVEDVSAFAQRHDINSSILLGNQAIRDEFNVTAYPTYYLLDADQRIVGGSKGYSTAAGLKLRAWLNRYPG